MYEATPDLTSLRQGDVIKGIYFPQYSFPALAVLQKLDDAGELTFDERIVLGAAQDFAVVLSQCCEFTAGKRQAFSLAALRRIKDCLTERLSMWGFNLARLVPSRFTRMTPDQLRAANAIDENALSNAAVNLYLYDADGTVLTEPHVVDFTRVISVRIQDDKKALRSKVLQLDDQHRLEFQAKLGYFYSRTAQ